MKTQVMAALAALVAVAALGSPALAQNAAGANAQKYGVAVVDINYIFKNHQKFITAMDALKLDQRAVDEVHPLISDLMGRCVCASVRACVRTLAFFLTPSQPPRTPSATASRRCGGCRSRTAGVSRSRTGW